MNSLLNELNNNDIHAIGYTDDITILIDDKIEATLGDLMQSTLNIAECWCKQNDLTIKSATELLVFITKRKTNITNMPMLFNKPTHFVYTDGSKTKEGIEAGVPILLHSQKKKKKNKPTLT